MLHLNNEIDALDVELDRQLKTHPGYRDLLKVKGIGPVPAAIFVVDDRRHHPLRHRRVQGQCEPTVAKVRQYILARRGREGRNVAKLAAGGMLQAVFYVLRDGQANVLTTTPAARPPDPQRDPAPSCCIVPGATISVAE